ncbi:MAG: hypothetical protein MN733_32185 [Nitrososphaera sp.]|nr:hypothetical protein [Nitrososphaera sp.]
MASLLGAILLSSIYSSAFGYSTIASNMNDSARGLGSDVGTGSLSLAEDHNGKDKPHGPPGQANNDKENGNNGKSGYRGNSGKQDKGKSDDEKDRGYKGDEDRPSMLKPIPQSLSSFELVAEGTSMAKREGRDGPFNDASLEIRADLDRAEGNHFRFHASGQVELGEDEYDIVDAQGIIIFFKNLRGAKSVAGLLHIVGKTVIDEDGNDLGKFRLRALVIGQDEDKWRVIVFPAAKLGPHIRLINMEGTITGLVDGVTSSPASGALHHFVVGNISSPAVSGSLFNVTVTAHMSNGTILKSYDERVRVTDLTGSVKPVMTPRFQDGVFKGTLNITKAIPADKVTFTDSATGKNGTSNSFAVLAGSLAKVDLAPSEATLNPGDEEQFTAKGLDKFGNELSGLSFVWALSSSDFGSISTAGNKANFTASTSITSNANVNLTASVGAVSDISKISISPVTSNALDHFVVANISSPQTAGAPFSITVRAVNSTGGTIMNYSGPMILTDTTGDLNMTINSGFAIGVWTGNVNITTAEDDVRITAKDMAAPSKKGTSNKFDVVAGPLDHFDFGNVANQTAGTQFSVAVKAEDAFDNTKMDFLGLVTLSTNDGASPIGNLTSFVPNPYNFTASDEGQHTFAVTMYNARENVTITANGSGKSGTSNEFDVRPASVANVTVSPTSATVSPGGIAVFNAEAFDEFGNEVEGADFNWELDTGTLGDLNVDSDTSSAEFVADLGVLVTTSGNITAEVGSTTGTAGITVSV